MTEVYDFIGVILAAGKGSRMYPFSERTPKSLLPILNRPLLAHQLDSMAGAGIKKVIIVIGYFGFEVVKAIGDGGEWGVEIEYVDQQQTLGIAHALGRLEHLIDRPFLMFLGDIYFKSPQLKEMLKPVASGEAQAVLAASHESDQEALRRNFAIIKGADGMVRRVMEKPRYANTDLKGCGLYAFDLQVFDAVRRTPRTAGRDEYEITDSIELLIEDGLSVMVMDEIEYDINLTCPEDILVVNQKALQHQGLTKLVGKNFSGPPPEAVTGSVIGDNVTLPASISVKDCVIFGGSTVVVEEDLERVIITPENVVRLNP